jgi:hypothetical protein
MISEVTERAAQRDAEKYRHEQLAIFKQEQARKKQIISSVSLEKAEKIPFPAG